MQALRIALSIVHTEHSICAGPHNPGPHLPTAAALAPGWGLAYVGRYLWKRCPLHRVRRGLTKGAF